MRHIGWNRFGTAAVAAVVAALSVPACQLLVGSCNCPNAGGGYVLLPAAQSTPIASVAADPPCWAMTSGGSDYINVTRGSAGTCNVRATLANGDVYAVSVEFQSIDPDGCCANVVHIVGTPAPQLIHAGDGGTD